MGGTWGGRQVSGRVPPTPTGLPSAHYPPPLDPSPTLHSNLATETNKMATKTDDDFKTWEEATTALGHTKVWNTSTSSVEFKPFFAQRNQGLKEKPRKCDRVYSFAPCPHQVDMLKTDIEGSEFELLHGIVEASPSLPMQVGPDRRSEFKPTRPSRLTTTPMNLPLSSPLPLRLAHSSHRLVSSCIWHQTTSKDRCAA